jgi:very-short-patch-repair endonuclease
MIIPRYCLYNTDLQPRANALRHRMTKAEVYLWKFVLKARKMMGYQFRRQRPVLWYIADFMCKELRLIIECDGSSHDNPHAAIKDAKRQEALEAQGFIVLRFRNEEVIYNIPGVRRTIEETIRGIIARGEGHSA